MKISHLVIEICVLIWPSSSCESLGNVASLGLVFSCETVDNSTYLIGLLWGLHDQQQVKWLRSAGKVTICGCVGWLLYNSGQMSIWWCSCLENPRDGGAWWAAVHGVARSRTWLSNFTFTFHFHALEKAMATHSSVLAWRIPRMVEPGGLPSMGSHRVGHDWSDLAAAAAAELWSSELICPYISIWASLVA